MRTATGVRPFEVWRMTAASEPVGNGWMADIGRPEREIEVRPSEPPVPSELPVEPPAPMPREPLPDAEPVPA